MAKPINKQQAIKLFLDATDKDDPYWSNLTDEFYDEKNDSIITIYEVFEALGISKDEVLKADRGGK
jgi:hypothetical protein